MAGPMKRASCSKRLLTATALSSVGLGDRGREHPLEGGKAQRPEAAADERDRAHQGHGERVRLPQHGQQHRDTHVRALKAKQQLALVVAVGERARRQAPDQVGNRVEEPDQAQRRGRAAEQQHHVAEGGRLHPVAGQRDQHAGRVAAEAAVAQRAERDRAPGAALGRPATPPPTPRLGPRSSPYRRHRVCLETPVPQPVRHTDAGRLARTRAGEHDGRIAGEVRDAARDHVRRDPPRTLEPAHLVLVAPYVEQQRAAGTSSRAVSMLIREGDLRRAEGR